MSFLKRHWLALVAAAVALLLAVVFWQPLSGWFLNSRPGAAMPSSAQAGHADGGSAGAAPLYVFGGSAKQALELAFAGYEQVRGELAADRLERLGEIAPSLAQALREAKAREPELPQRLANALTRSEDAAQKLASAGDAEQARTLFGELSQGLVTVALEDPQLVSGWSLFECPMVTGYKRWLQPDPQMANPYMGKRMLKCGSTLSLHAEADAHRASLAAAGDPDEVAYYTCPMHPGVKQSQNTPCPICGMDLVAVTRGDLLSGEVTVDEVRRQKIGVKIEEVKKSASAGALRTVGEVTLDETTLQDVTLKVGGWIRGLKVDATGQPVKKGQVLFHLYSPELFASQQEYLLALRAAGGNVNDSLVQAARQRLRLWDLGDAQLQALAERGEAQETVPIRSPATGFIMEKDVVEGAAVEPGMRLYQIANTDRVWIETQIYEGDLPLVKVGMPAEISLPFVPGKSFRGKVTYVYPYLEAATRTGTVRIELPNPDGVLKPKMYADVTFRLDRGERVQVPASAIIYTGPRRLVFVDLGEGRLRPREVKLGLRNGDMFEVVEGLVPGERVVTSGNFLIAAESRLRSATEYWGGEMQSGDGEQSSPEAPSGAGHAH